MNSFIRLFSTALALAFLPLAAHAADDPVLIDKILFKQIPSNGITRVSQGSFWNRVEIVLLAKENPDDKANNTKWVRNVEVDLALVYKDEKAADKASAENLVVMKAKARLFALEVGKKTSVVYYIPGEAYSIYRIQKDPFAWSIELSVNGVKTPLSKSNLKTMLSKTILKSSDPKKAYESYKKLVESAAPTNEGVLMPLPQCPFNVQYFEYMTGGNVPIPTYIYGQ